jgi:hypothetical protein
MVHCTMPKPRIIALHKSALAVAPGLVRCAATTVSEVTGSQE